MDEKDTVGATTLHGTIGRYGADGQHCEKEYGVSDHKL